MNASPALLQNLPRRSSGTPIVEPFKPASKNAGGAIVIFYGLMTLVTLVFAALKLSHAVVWSWYAVFSPQLVPAGLLMALALAGGAVFLIRAVASRVNRSDMVQLTYPAITLPHSMTWNRTFPCFSIDRVSADTRDDHVIVDDRGKRYRMPKGETIGALTSMFRAVSKTTPTSSFIFVTHDAGNGHEVLVACDHADHLRAALAGSE